MNTGEELVLAKGSFYHSYGNERKSLILSFDVREILLHGKLPNAPSIEFGNIP